MRVNIKATKKNKHRSETKKNKVFTQLATASPVEIHQYINKHVKDLPTARDMLANLAIIVGQIIKDQKL